MKTLYFDCSSGISGNMTLGALLEIVGDENYLINELKKLNVDGYNIQISKKVKNGITGTYVDVILETEGEHKNKIHNHEHNNHENHKHHEHRNLNDIYKIIESSTIDEKSKDLSKRIFKRVAEAEAKVHNKSIEEVHFHEVGAIDSIIDIVGTAILINKINPEKILSSIVNDGYGFIECAHGIMSVPVPATSQIFANSKVKFRQIDIDTELVTPTGAAIIAELSDEFINMPPMEIEKIGWGAGYKDLKIPNILKVYFGNLEENDDIKELEENSKTIELEKNNEAVEFQKNKNILNTEKNKYIAETEKSKYINEIEKSPDIIVIETNIDDCPGEILGFTEELLFKNGALDVFFTPIFMKKNRPAYRLSVTCKPEDLSKMQNIIFKQTTTIGIRYRKEYRTVLKRKEAIIQTKYGKIKAKKVENNGETYIYPEYESIKEIAEKNNIPIKELYKMPELQ